jgi:hypothetical protein
VLLYAGHAIIEQRGIEAEVVYPYERPTIVLFERLPALSAVLSTRPQWLISTNLGQRNLTYTRSPLEIQSLALR